jgi:hypothetical protein
MTARHHTHSERHHQQEQAEQHLHAPAHPEAAKGDMSMATQADKGTAAEEKGRNMGEDMDQLAAGKGTADSGTMGGQGMMGQAGETMRRGAAGAMRGAHVAEGRVMGFVDTTLTDAVHVTGHVASEVVTTVANVLGDVVGGLTDVVRRGISGARPGAMMGRSGQQAMGMGGGAEKGEMGEHMHQEETRR